MSKMNIDLQAITPHEGFGDVLSEPIDRTRRWSEYQTSIFAFVEHGQGNAIVMAVAGSGKSTTIIEAMKLVRGSSIFLAFNKSIADELKKLGVNARTFHSLCFSAVLRATGAAQPEPNKLKIILRERITIDDATIERGAGISAQEQKMYGSFAMRMVGLARQVGMGFLTKDTFEAWMEICAHHDIEPEQESADLGRAIEISRQLLQWSNESKLIDFDDMLYIAVRDRLNLPKFDFVFVDEAQDTNMIQREILRMIMRSDSRMIAVGDPAQAIYGFRGADAQSLDMIASEFNAQTLPLSITYRCPKAVVRYVQQWVSHIEAAPTADEGVVEHRELDWDPTMFAPEDLVVCRKTAPLIRLAFRCIKANVPAQVMGRDIGQGLKALIQKMNPRNLTHLTEQLNKYLRRELEKAQKDEDEKRAESLNDTVGSLLFLIDSLREDRRTLDALDQGIDYLFKDKGNAVKLATIHKAKGLEADNVWWLNRNECPATWARMPWQKQEEIHLCYVAGTRAKKRLSMIEDGK